MTFGKTALVCLMMSSLVLWGAWLNHMQSNGPNEPFRPISLGTAEVFGALAALTAGSVALQVMAQAVASKPSPTLREHQNRQYLAMLALLGPGASCSVGLLVWLAIDISVHGAILYLLTITTLTAINIFVGSDAAHRIMNSDDDNILIQIGLARKSLGRWRRRRLPVNKRTSVISLSAMAVFQTTAVAVAGTVLTTAALTKTTQVDLWPSFLGHFLAAGTVCALMAIGFRFWVLGDRSVRLMVGLVGLVAAATLADLLLEAFDSGTYAFVKVLIGTLLPLLLSASAFITRDNRTNWMLPSWVPGTWIRFPTAKRLEHEHLQTVARLKLLRVKQGTHARSNVPFAQLLAVLPSFLRLPVSGSRGKRAAS